MRQLGSRSCQIEEIYSEQEKSLNKKKTQVLREQEQEESNGNCDQYKYMQHFNWPEKVLKASFKIENLFWHGEEGEEIMIWCPGVIKKIINTDKDGTKVIVKWKQGYIG